MTKYWRRPVITAMILAFLVGAAQAATENRQQSHAVISDTVSRACHAQASQRGYDQVDVQVQALNKHMKLPHCPVALNTLLPQPERALGQISVGVRCEHPDTAWTIYVRATVSALQVIPVLNRPLVRGDIISADDIQQQTLPARSAVKGVALSAEQVIGRELTRATEAGTPLRLRYLRLPELVKQGQMVMLIARGNGVEIKVKGKAQQGGALGQQVRVTNLSSGQTVQGIVEEDGSIGIY